MSTIIILSNQNWPQRTTYTFQNSPPKDEQHYPIYHAYLTMMAQCDAIFMITQYCSTIFSYHHYCLRSRFHCLWVTLINFLLGFYLLPTIIYFYSLEKLIFKSRREIKSSVMPNLITKDKIKQLDNIFRYCPIIFIKNKRIFIIILQFQINFGQQMWSSCQGDQQMPREPYRIQNMEVFMKFDQSKYIQDHFIKKAKTGDPQTQIEESFLRKFTRDTQSLTNQFDSRKTMTTEQEVQRNKKKQWDKFFPVAGRIIAEYLKIFQNQKDKEREVKKVEFLERLMENKRLARLFLNGKFKRIIQITKVRPENRMKDFRNSNVLKSKIVYRNKQRREHGHDHQIEEEGGTDILSFGSQAESQDILNHQNNILDEIDPLSDQDSFT